MLSSNVSIYDHDHDTNEGVLNAGRKFVVVPVIINNEVWCGTNVVIVKGSRIGSNCVVGANSLVNGKLDNNYLYVRNPVKALKKINDGSERV